MLISQAISSGQQLHFSSRRGAVKFNLRVLGFEKIDLSEVDGGDQVDADEGGSFWNLKVEIVNLSKTKADGVEIRTVVVLIDQEGFQFEAGDDDQLTYESEFAKRSGIRRMYDGNALTPKIKVVAAIPFFLPDDDEAIYSIGACNGKIEVLD